MQNPMNDRSVAELADRYADELSAQFRTLNLFVQHAGEIGRAHERFLAGVLKRFLPEKLRCGNGFIASAKQVTQQQDIIIYDAHCSPFSFALVTASSSIMKRLSRRSR